MRVHFDLRPPHLVQMQETKINPLRLAGLLLFAVFMLVSLFNVVYSMMQIHDMRQELNQVKFEQAQASDSGRLIARQIETMRALRDEVKEYVAFVKQDIPSVEFLAALEAAVPLSTKLSNIEMHQASVLMRGSSLADQDVIDFGSNLGAIRGVVAHVDAPVTTHRNDGRRMISDFTISCTINDLAAAAEASNSNESEASKQ